MAHQHCMKQTLPPAHRRLRPTGRGDIGPTAPLYRHTAHRPATSPRRLHQNGSCRMLRHP